MGNKLICFFDQSYSRLELTRATVGMYVVVCGITIFMLRYPNNLLALSFYLTLRHESGIDLIV